MPKGVVDYEGQIAAEQAKIDAANKKIAVLREKKTADDVKKLTAFAASQNLTVPELLAAAMRDLSNGSAKTS